MRFASAGAKLRQHASDGTDEAFRHCRDASTRPPRLPNARIGVRLFIRPNPIDGLLGQLEHISAELNRAILNFARMRES